MRACVLHTCNPLLPLFNIKFQHVKYPKEEDSLNPGNPQKRALRESAKRKKGTEKRK